MAMGSNDHPVLVQGHGVWLLSGTTVRTVSEETSDEIWTYEVEGGKDDVAFAAHGNRVFVKTAVALYALPVF
ncbi:hypothetical protein [Streptomyces nogalater]|uniref:Uncharacterized protein n=1 Tax=Streptomyces nogalater TaxID=38314 RepID=A0ABW0WM90_STRNO